jgi:hypothetical protein
MFLKSVKASSTLVTIKEPTLIYNFLLKEPFFKTIPCNKT